MKISYKLSLLALFILADFIGIGLIYGYSLKIGKEASIQRENTEKISWIINSIHIDVLQARREEKDFLLYHQTSDANAHDKVMAELGKKLDELQALLPNAPQRAVVDSMRQPLKAYQNGFQQVVALKTQAGLDESSGLRGTLREAVHTMEEYIESVDEIELNNALLQLRRHEKDYLAREDDKYIEKFNKTISSFSKMLAAANIADVLKAQLEQQLPLYRDGFLALTEAMKASSVQVNALRKAVHAVEPKLAQLLEEDRKIAAADAEFQQQQSHRVTLLMITTISVISIVVMTLLILLTRQIIRSLQRGVVFAEQLAIGDLTARVDVTVNDEIGQLLQAMQVMNTKLKQVVEQIANSTSQVTSAATEIAQGSADLSQRTEKQASTLEETASSMEELTATVKQSADNASQANQLVGAAQVQAEQGGQVVEQTITAMSAINTSSRKIADIINVIDEIAFQTNLLALNAAVEAARAGEQGKGFAVVAGEVRKLAQRSADAAKEIKRLITDSVAEVQDGGKLVEQSGKTLQEIIVAVKKVSDIVAEITTASREQASGIEQVNRAILSMDQVTQQNAALVEETAAASQSMSEQAHELQDLMGFFKLDQRTAATIDFKLAANQHLAWKARLHRFLEGKEHLTEAQLTSHRECDLGRWIYASGMEKYGHIAEMQDMEKEHAEFHNRIKTLFSLKKRGQKDQAKAELVHIEHLSDQTVALLNVVASKIQ